MPSVNIVIVLREITYLLIVLAVPVTVVGSIAFWRTQKGGAKTFSLLIERGSIVRLSAIFAIVFCGFVLALADKISSEAIASILSGIAGYVLGGANSAAVRKKAQAESSDDE